MKRAVVDQPGLKIIFAGLLLAIFFGLLIRSQITQAKVQNYLRTAIQDIKDKNKEQNLSIDFAEAKLSLSDWGMPFPHLVINNIQISSSSAKCANNQIYIDRLDIPFSWGNLFATKIKWQSLIDTIRIGQAEIRLDNLSHCLSQEKNTKPVGVAAANTTGFISSSKSTAPVPGTVITENEFSVLFEKIKIIDKHNYNLPLILQAVSTKLIFVKNELWQAEIKSQLFLFRDLDRGIYQVRADLNLNYTHHSDQDVKATAIVKGKLIDKSFDVNLDYDHINKKVLIKHEMSDLSLKALVKLFNKNEITDQVSHQVEGVTGLALSNKGTGEYNLHAPDKSFYKISNVVIASGESAATVDLISIESVKPFRFLPFKIVLDQFNLEKIKTISSLSSINKSIHNLGKISGEIFIDSIGKVSSAGKISDIEFIFSNRGRRAHQKIENLSYSYQNSQLFLKDIKLEGKNVSGEAKIDLFSGASQRYVDIKLSDIALSEQVYDIFSFQQIKKTLLSLSVHLEKNNLKAKIKFDQLASPFFDLKQAEVFYEAMVDAQGKAVNPTIDLTVKNLRISKSDSSEESFYTILDLFEPGQPVTEFYFDGLKAKYLRKDENLYEINILANYFSKTKNDKGLVSIDSQYIESSKALFNFNLHQGRKNTASKIQSDLTRFNFEVLK